MTVVEAAARWREVWSRAWSEHDADAIVALYAEDARFRSAPFREESRGRGGVREYVEWAFASELRSECRFGQPIVAGDRAVVEYWAAIDDREVGLQTLAGASLLRFDAEGLVAQQRDYWHVENGRREPPGDWGA